MMKEVFLIGVGGVSRGPNLLPAKVYVILYESPCRYYSGHGILANIF
jgi:hypothetical protein